jgi:hypothetical protein
MTASTVSVFRCSGIFGSSKSSSRQLKHINPGLANLGLAVLLLVTSQAIAQGARSNAATVGQWQILSNQLTLNPIHAAVMHTGKVLMIDGSNGRNPVAAIWDPVTQLAPTFPVSYPMFCNGMVVLADGRPFVIGGTLKFGQPFTGLNRASAYDPIAGTFTEQVPMARGRWYPTGTVLSDGTVMTFSGTDEWDVTNNTVEIFTPNSGTGAWSTAVTANWVPPLYPRMTLLPDGRIFYSATTATSKFYDLTTQTWTNCCTTNFGANRTQSTTVLLPLRSSNGFAPKVMIMGGTSSEDTAPATNTTEIIDLSVSKPAWVYGPNMSQPRIHLNSTILPTGNVLVTGGEEWSENTTTASLNADLYHANVGDPNYNTFTSAGANSVPRAYHSNAMLLPDATVILTGSNPPNVPYETRVELYQPAYLFNADGTMATRPVITRAPTTSIRYNTSFTIQTPNAAQVATVVLMRPGTPTHAFNMDQRLIGVQFKSTTSGSLTIASPPNADVAPPGYYMLFILNKAGVPSVAQFVQFCPTSGCI